VSFLVSYNVLKFWVLNQVKVSLDRLQQIVGDSGQRTVSMAHRERERVSKCCMKGCYQYNPGAKPPVMKQIEGPPNQERIVPWCGY
jgi:hypothetical protein